MYKWDDRKVICIIYEIPIKGELNLGSFRFIIRLLGKYKVLVIYYIFFGILSAILSMIIPQISSGFINLLVKTESKYENLYTYILLFIVASLINVIFSYITGLLYMKLLLKLKYMIQQMMINSLRLSTNIHEVQHSELAQKSEYDSGVLIEMVLSSLQNIISGIIVILVSIIILFKINIIICIILVALSSIYMILYFLFRNILYQTNKESIESNTNYFRKLFDQYRLVEFAKANVCFQLFDKYFYLAFTKRYSAALRLQNVSYSFTSLDTIITAVAQIIVFLVGGKQVFLHRISIGEFTVILIYFNMTLNSIRYFLNLGKSVKTAEASFDRINRTLELKNNVQKDKKITLVENIEIKNIKFRERNLEISKHYFLSKNNIYVIVGPNGSGKSTLLQLISGLYIVKDEEVYINGENIKDLNMYSVRKDCFSILEQIPVILDEKVLENINLYEDVELDMVKLNDLFNLMFEEDIKDLPSYLEQQCQYQSDGEKQKIGIIRTLIKKSDVILMDEPTASIDISSKNRLLEYLQKIKTDKIIVVATHDIELMNLADEVIYL